MLSWLKKKVCLFRRWSTFERGQELVFNILIPLETPPASPKIRPDEDVDMDDKVCF
jgi:hypothetical protein